VCITLIEPATTADCQTGVAASNGDNA